MAIPSGLGLSKPTSGKICTLEHQFARLAASGKKAPLVLFLSGSLPLGQERQMADWVVETLGFILIAPNTHIRSDRPQYTSPTDYEIYETVHRMRREEVEYAMKRIEDMEFIDRRFIVLAGVSEGAITAATWPSDAVIARMAMAWNCEPGYYIKDVRIAGNPEQTPFLNLIGYADHFFGSRSKLSEGFETDGHGAKLLKDFKHAKIVMYPAAGHRILEHQETRNDVVNFLQYWQDYYLV